MRIALRRLIVDPISGANTVLFYIMYINALPPIGTRITKAGTVKEYGYVFDTCIKSIEYDINHAIYVLSVNDIGSIIDSRFKFKDKVQALKDDGWRESYDKPKIPEKPERPRPESYKRW